MRRREFIGLATGAVVGWPLKARAQQARKVPVIGFLTPGFSNANGPGTTFAGLTDGLRKEGYLDGETIRIEARFAEGKPESLAGFAEDLVRLKVDVLVTAARPSIEAAKAATRDIPIVALDLESDPVASGYVASLAAPGGNITGLFLDAPDLTGKWLQLVRDVVPDARRIAVLWDANTGEYQLRALSAAAKATAVDVQVIEFRNSTAMEPALTSGLSKLSFRWDRRSSTC
jgi:putative ABC transport system substrate-binding protein